MMHEHLPRHEALKPQKVHLVAPALATVATFEYLIIYSCE